MFSEDKRQIVHIALFILAFSLKFLTRWQAAALLLLLLIFTLVVVPKLHLKKYFYRHFEKKYSEGAVLYFLTLLVLVLVFPLPIVAASWAILALGDGCATLIGQHFKCRELPWNHRKTIPGSVAFFIFGFFGSAVLLWWMLPQLDWTSIISASFKTVIIATLVESLPLRINDNVSVSIASALVLSFLKIV